VYGRVEEGTSKLDSMGFSFDPVATAAAAADDDDDDANTDAVVVARPPFFAVPRAEFFST